MSDDTLSFVAVLIALVVLAAVGGVCFASAVYAERRFVRILFTMLAYSTVVAFAITIALMR